MAPDSSIEPTLTVRLLGRADSGAFDNVAPDVFDNAIDGAFVAEFLQDSRHHMAVAISDGVIVGMASAVHYVHPDKAAQLFINEVAVSTLYQRAGVGSRLMRRLLALGRELGCTEAWVATEPGNVAAQALYSGAGGQKDPAPFVMYTFALESSYSSESPDTVMTSGKSVLIIGLEPTLIDFTAPEFAAFPGLDAVKLQAALDAEAATLKLLGYDALLCLTDFGQTAGEVVLGHLQQKRFDCIVIGAGVRTIPRHFLLFEKLVNIVHEHAPQARICFNTKPGDTAQAVQRWTVGVKVT